MFSNIPLFLRTCAPGDTIKMFVKDDPLTEPYMLFRYFELKVTSHDIKTHSCRRKNFFQRHEIKFDTVKNNGQGFDTLMLSDTCDPVNFVNALIGPVYWVNVKTFIDASSTSPRVVAEIVSEQETLAPVWKERRTRVLCQIPPDIVNGMIMVRTVNEARRVIDEKTMALFKKTNEAIDLNSKLFYSKFYGN